MKKLFNGRFLFILASSLVVLILLVVGAFFLFNDEDDKFVKSGYVLNPLSSTAEKYFFEENIGYKENLSSMIEFVDVDDKTVSILKDSFIHYNDESLSFMKKGAILDLDSVKGDRPVAFYNITNESIINRNDDSYVIKSANGDIKLDNFIGRISENKYIVVGDLNLRMVGNSVDVKGEYFEIVYVEEGIVNIENKDVKYQVAAERTTIKVGNDKVIDLGDKKITVNGADAMSITSITINGDENIEIIPGAKEEEENDNDDNQGSNGEDVGQNNQTGTGENIDNSNGNSQAGDDNPGDGDDTTEEEDDKETKEIEITLVPEKTHINSSSISFAVKIENASEDDSFNLKVTHLEEGSMIDWREDIISDTPDASPYITSGLKSSTKYMYRIINNKNDQTVKTWVFETKDLGVKIEKEYATSYSLAFNVFVDEESDIDDVDIILERFDDSDKVMDFVSDINADEKIENDEGRKTLSTGCQRDSNDTGKYFCVFGDVVDKLKSDSIYRVKMNNFKSGQYTTGNDVVEDDNHTLSVMTLKKRPSFAPNEMTASITELQDKFIIDIGSVIDENNSIINYTYLIYELKDNTLSDDPVMPPISKKDNSSFSIGIAKGAETATTLSLGKSYKYRVVVEYFDNEKYYEFISREVSSEFLSGDIPSFVVEPNEEEITDKSISATIKITDIGCRLPMSGRKNCGNADANVKVRISEADQNNISTGNVQDFPDVNFDTSDDILEGKLEISKINGRNLQPGYYYTIEVYAEYDSTHDGDDVIQYAGPNGKNIIVTKTRASFDVAWNEAGLISDEENVINTSIQLTGSTTNDSTMDFAATADKIKVIEVSIYRGDTGDKKDSEFLGKGTWTDTDDFDIKTNFFDKKFNISSSDPKFNLSYEYLKEKNREENGEYVNQYYTLVVEAWYDDDKSSSEMVTLSRNRVYRYMVSSNLLREIEIDFKISKITHAQRRLEMNQYLNRNSTEIGYSVDIGFDWNNFEKEKNWIPKNVYINVYHFYDNSYKKLDFYYLDENGELKKTTDKTYKYSLDKGSSDPKINLHSADSIVEIFAAPGTIYDNNKPDNEVLTRGNYFTIGYEIEYEYTTDDGKRLRFFDTPVSIANSNKFVDNPEKTGTGIYIGGQYIEKESPMLSMWPLTSDASSITYAYELSDPDYTLYKEEDGYNFHTVVNGVTKNHPMVKVDGVAYNKFKGELKIDELSTPEMKHGMSYSYYYKRNTLKTGEPKNDIKDVFEGENIAGRKFDGEYRLAENADEYKFSYSLDYNDEKTNNVIINFSSMKNDVFDRILSFRVQLKDKKNKVINYELDDATLKDFVVCPGAPATATPRCLSIDYTKIKDMKSTTDNANPITVTVTAIYDNGLTGYELLKSLGKTENDENPYMIMQENSTAAAYGSYITYDYNGQKLTVWKNEPYQINKTESVIPAKGYFKWSERKEEYYYANKRFPNFKVISFGIVNLVRNENGYSFSNSPTDVNVDEISEIKGKYFNPKMVSVDQVPCSNNNVFKFYKIKPKVEVSEETTKLINGFVFDLKLSSFDIDSVKEENGKYYVYVETWDYDNVNKAYVVDPSDIEGDSFVAPRARPRVQIEVDKNGRVLESAKIDGLLDIDKHPKEYRFGIYAYMLAMDENNNLIYDENGKPLYVYERIADANNILNYIPKSYTSKVASSSELYNKLDFRHDPALDYVKDGVNPFENKEFKYGDRILKNTFSLKAYSSNSDELPLNYNIHYVLCEKNVCGKGFNADKENSLLYEKIDNEKFKKGTTAYSYVDLTKYENIEYGNDYEVYIYFEYQHYKDDSSTDESNMESLKFLVNYEGTVNGSGDYFHLDKLIKPSFSFKRNGASFDENGNYYIDFGINPTDNDNSLDKSTQGDQVLKDGKYRVKLEEIIYDIEFPDKPIDKIVISENMEGYEDFKMQICDAGVCTDVSDNYLEYEFSALGVVNQNVRFIGLKPQTEYEITAYGDIYLNNFGLTEEEKNDVAKNSETAYSANMYGLAFGKANYEIEPNSWTITFSGASNLQNNNLIKSIEVIIKNNSTGNEKTYIGKGFEKVSETSNNLKLVINTDSNKVGTEYDAFVRIILDKIDPESGENIVIDSSVNRSFAIYKKPYSVKK